MASYAVKIRLTAETEKTLSAVDQSTESPSDAPTGNLEQQDLSFYHVTVPFIACGDLEGFDSDTTFSLKVVCCL